ncbi:MAG: hypothetical protein NT006_07950 [Candidatus Aminicenantes bacterium]|nr:hypothetical protein [Candidatus Aminicenantes bacterium]
MDARVEEDHFFRQLAEIDLGALPAGRPTLVDLGFPGPEPSRQDEKRAVLEKTVEDLLVGDPLEALAFLDEPAGLAQSEVLLGPGQAVAAEDANGTPVVAEGPDGFAQAVPFGFDLVTINRQRFETDVLEIRGGLDGQDFPVKVRAGDQREITGHVPHYHYPENMSQYWTYLL